jgi:transcription elongation GreA/GreB family factor
MDSQPADTQPSEPRSTLTELEDRFIAVLQTSPIPIDDAIELVRAVSSSPGRTADWTQMLQDALIKAGDATGLIRWLRTQAVERAGDRAFGSACAALLRKSTKDRALLAFVDCVAFGEAAPSESFRRLHVLQALKPHTLCMDRTWGLGVVQRVDDFYRKLMIDFHGKPSHQMTFAYGAEALTPVDDQHLLARQRRDPAAMALLVADEPDEVVRLALRSFGPMPVGRLEQTLAERHVVAAGDWKRFWEAARKRLKNDPLVVIPTKRTESIIIRAQAEDFGASWLDTLARERDIGRILAAIETHETQAAQAPDDATRETITERLTFAIKGAHNTDAAMYARLAMAVRRLKLDRPPVTDLRAHLWENDRFIEAAGRLSARDSAALAAFLLEDDPEAPARILSRLSDLPFALMCEVMTCLRGSPADAAAQLRCRDLLSAPHAPPALLVWAIRNRADFAAWNLSDQHDLMVRSVALLEENLSGEDLRMQNSLRQLFENAKWFETAFTGLDALQRQSLFERIQAAAAWDPTTRRSLIGRMIRIEPALAERRKSSGASDDKPAGRWTSWRSLTARQAQYRRLIEEEIPKNSQDIATARSYGDLRENFEYHAAKHQQGLLLQRQGEMENDLKQVKGTDFTTVPTERAGIGTCVTIAYPDGRRQTFNILGEWDRDEALNIISSKSRLAQCLEGRRTGDAAIVPSATGDEPVMIESVSALPDAVRAWVGAQLAP